MSQTMRILLTLFALTILVFSASQTFSQSPDNPTIVNKTTANLDEQVKNLIAPFKGKVTLFAKNLDTGETYGLNADERVRTASTIKIAVMIEAFARVSEGKAKWTDGVVLTKEKKVSGSGILAELSDNLHLTLRDAVNLMMILSDNTATNLVLDVLTTDAVNARMESLGFKQIKINRKVGSGGESMAGKDPENKKYGLGFATPREMVLVMEKMERGEIINPAVSKEMIDLMKREQARYAIGRSLWDLPMASKYGALDRLRSAVGIVYSKKGKIAIAISCDDMPEIMWSVDNPAYLLMSRLSEVLVNGLGNG
jgi:beta-lactamase class A